MAPPATAAAFESKAHESTDTTLLRAATAPPVGAELFAKLDPCSTAFASEAKRAPPLTLAWLPTKLEPAAENEMKAAAFTTARTAPPEPWAAALPKNVEALTASCCAASACPPSKARPPPPRPDEQRVKLEPVRASDTADAGATDAA